MVDTLFEEGVDITMLSKKESDDYLARLLQRLIRTNHAVTMKQAERVQQVGELNGRLIFLNAAGHTPVKLQEHIQAILMPSAPPAEPINTPEVEDGDGE